MFLYVLAGFPKKLLLKPLQLNNPHIETINKYICLQSYSKLHGRLTNKSIHKKESTNRKNNFTALTQQYVIILLKIEGKDLNGKNNKPSESTWKHCS